MKKIAIIILALVVSASMSVGANAGWFGNDKKEEDKNEAHRFENYPTMKFYKGTLRRDTYAGWRLDDLSMQLMANSTVTTDGAEEGFLQEGKPAIVMGAQYGSTLVVWRVRVMQPENDYGQKDSNVHVEPGPNPDVGVGTGPE